MKPNATAVKFGYPDSLIAETTCWTVQLRPKQPTLGALVLVCKEPVTSFAALSTAAYAELQEVIGSIERCLKHFIAFERINYLMLMMVDPDVHFHVIPRYAGSRRHFDRDFVDAGWPEVPKLAEAVTLSDDEIAALQQALLRSGIRPIEAKTID